MRCDPFHSCSVSPARSIFSNAPNFRRSAIAALVRSPCRYCPIPFARRGAGTRLLSDQPASSEHFDPQQRLVRLRRGPGRLAGARPGADPDLRAGRPEPRHGRALRHWQRPVSRLARPHHVHDDDNERCDAVLRLRRPPPGHGHWITSPLMARSSPPFRMRS